MEWRGEREREREVGEGGGDMNEYYASTINATMFRERRGRERKEVDEKREREGGTEGEGKIKRETY